VFFIIEDNLKHEQDMIEANQLSVMAAISSVLNGKHIKLFDDNNDYEVVDENVYEDEKNNLKEKYKAIGGDLNE